MSKKDYKNWTKDELIREIDTLRKRKKYGLIWENKPEDVVEQCKTELPVLEEVKDKEILTDPEKPTNLLIEGDNYHALSVLNYTHKGRVDVIYIDPPYNTGAKTWKYNNCFVDGEDPYRHTKWISWMEHRLTIAKNLLSREGIICVTIDDFELPRLWLLIEEIFGEVNHLGTVVIRNNPSGRSTVKGFSIAHEYALFFSKSQNVKIGRLERNEEQLARYNEKDDQGVFEWVNFRKHGGSNSFRKARPRLFYPFFVSKTAFRIPKMKWDEAVRSWEILEKPHTGEVVVLPVNKLNEERTWKWGHETVLQNLSEFMVKDDQHGNWAIYMKSRMNEEGLLPLTFWDKTAYSATAQGTNMLKDILGESDKFPFPKSLFAVIDCLKVAGAHKDAVILDFFAGSGTTGHAVLELNRRDGGNRKFILCTNNENSIADGVCHPRIKKVIEGYSYSGTDKTILYEVRLDEKRLKNVDALMEELEAEKGSSEGRYEKFEIKVEDNHLRLYGVRESKGLKEGLGGNLKYFKTTFVPADPTDKNKIALTRKATAMLCIKEDTFEEVISNDQFKIFQNGKKYTGVIFDHHAIPDFKKNIVKINGKFSVYVFSLGDDTFDEEFEDVSSKVKVAPIPEAILRVYRRIFQ